MGDCRYCGKSAGFLRKEHKECAAAHAQGLDSIGNVCVEAALHGVEVNQLPSKVRAIGAVAYIDTSEAAMATTLARGWGQALKAAMDDHFLSNEEKRALNRYRAHYNLSASHLDRNGHFTLFRMMNLLNALSEHGLVPRFDGARSAAFNLMKSEELLWLFGGTDYFEQITRRSSEAARWASASGWRRRLHPAGRVPRPFGRIEFGAAYRLGHAGHHDQAYLFQREQQEFPGQAVKIVSFDPYEDGLGIMRDTARAKPEIFRMGATDAWFLLNIIDAVMGMDSVTLPKAGARRWTILWMGNLG